MLHLFVTHEKGLLTRHAHDIVAGSTCRAEEHGQNANASQDACLDLNTLSHANSSEFHLWHVGMLVNDTPLSKNGSALSGLTTPS